MSAHESLITETDSTSSVKETRKKRRKTSDKHFRHREEKLKIDFVLAAKNVQKDSMTEREKENEKRRRTYFRKLRKKHLKISKRFVSIVSVLF